jgi:RimJ/RimL family protein N-acetyltransferase
MKVYLTNGNLTIRSAESPDTKILCKWWNDGKVMAHAGFPKGLDINEETIRKELENDSEIKARLIIEENHIPIGEMSYRIIGNNSAQIGIKICDFNKQEKGYGTKFLLMLIGFLFEEKGCSKIILDTNLNNTRAQHVYEKIGFHKVSVNKNSWQDQLGRWQSSVDYELSKSDFENITKRVSREFSNIGREE